MAQINLLADVSIPKLKPIGIDPGGDGVGILEKIISQMIGLLTIIAVLFFVFQIILAGYAFISSDGDREKIQASRKRLTEGILGLTIVIVAVGLGSLLATLAGIPNILDLNAMFNQLGL